MRSTLLFPFLLATLTLALANCTAEEASPAAKKVHLRGTAYMFNTPDPLAGATIGIAELPDLQTKTAADGTYDLAVPDATKVTPFIVAKNLAVPPGAKQTMDFHTTHLQTFTTAGKDLEHVNFQTPDEGTYVLLATLVGIDLPSAATSCQIVSTFSVKAIQSLSFLEFTQFGAHGIGGATATSVPPLPTPIYFNAQVLPDASRKASSKDGGVLWVNVPAGVYTISAQHPDHKFASFVATCTPGRLVNANPPWGLKEL